MIVRPNVKVNLGLSVLRKRSDGYHDLETLFVPYPAISDILEIEESSNLKHKKAVSPDGKLEISIRRAGGIDWDPLQDLTAKAYYLLDAEYGLPPVKIRLQKNAPVGAGLGGGSADAAFALRALSELFGLSLPAATLAGLAARLGSDCPFFIYNRPMLGRGRGEILTPWDMGDFDSKYRLEVSVPEGIAVSTADAYRGIVPREALSAGTVSDASLEDILRLPVEEWKGLLVNDFEATVFQKYPALAAFKAELYKSGALYVAMSGSGSAFVSIFRK